jgi:hypothetical protein
MGGAEVKAANFCSECGTSLLFSPTCELCHFRELSRAREAERRAARAYLDAVESYGVDCNPMSAETVRLTWDAYDAARKRVDELEAANTR